MSTPASQDLVRQIYAAFSRGDVPAIIATLSPEVSWTVHGNGPIPYGGRHAGPAGVQRWFEILARSMTMTRFEVERLVGQDDTVVCLGEFACLAKDTGKPYGSAFAHVWHLRDGKVQAFDDFFDTAAASTAYRA